jgi:hypothetical protein
MPGQFVYSVRRLFSQGVLNDALLQPKTYPRASIAGGGNLVSGQRLLQQGCMVTNSSALMSGILGAGSPAVTPGLSHLVKLGGVL